GGGLDNYCVEPLGRRVDGGGQSGRACPDDDDVAHLAVVDTGVEAEMIRDGSVAGVPEHDLAAADHDGHVGGRNVRAVEQVRDVRVTLDVEIAERMPVAREELS